MTLERALSHHQQLPDNYVDPTGNYTMRTYDYLVRPSVTAPATITLPPVAEAKGRTYTILARVATPVNLITIVDSDGSERFSRSVLLAAGQSKVFYSDGLKWHDLTADQIVTYRVSMAAAVIRALRATPQVLAPAPGAGYLNEFMSVRLILDYGTNVLTEVADNLVVRYTNGSGVAVSTVIECTGFIDQTADTVVRGIPVLDAIATLAAAANATLVLHNNGDAEFGGNAANDTVLIAYTTVKIINNN